MLSVITGLPATLPTLPLELTVLYNSLLFTMGASDSAMEGQEGIHQGLLRGKEIVHGEVAFSVLWRCVMTDWRVSAGKLCSVGKGGKWCGLQPGVMYSCLSACCCLQGWARGFKDNGCL